MEIITHTFYSQCLRRDAIVSIVIPTVQKSGYPVLWIGGPGDHKSWLENTKIAEYANKIGLALIEADSSESWGGRDIEKNHYHFESYFTKELPDVVAKLVPLSDDPAQNFITGWSRAGYLALRIGLYHPERYGNILCFSGGNVDPYGLYRDIGGMFPGLLESQFDGISTAQEFEASQFNPENYIETLKNKGKQFPVLMFYCGSDDPLARIPNVRLSVKLDTWGIAHTLELLPGAHTWEFIDCAVEKALNRVGKTL